MDGNWFSVIYFPIIGGRNKWGKHWVPSSESHHNWLQCLTPFQTWDRLHFSLLDFTFRPLICYLSSYSEIHWLNSDVQFFSSLIKFYNFSSDVNQIELDYLEKQQVQNLNYHFIDMLYVWNPFGTLIFNI